MNKPITIPEFFKLVDGLPGCLTTNSGKTSDCISLKTATRVTVVVELNQAVGHATQIVLRQSTDVAATGAKVLTNVVPIWANEDCAASDTLVRKTDAVNYTVTNDVKKKLIVFQVEPADLDVANGFDCLDLTISDSSQATNFANVLFIVESRYQQTTPPAVITD